MKYIALLKKLINRSTITPEDYDELGHHPLYLYHGNIYRFQQFVTNLNLQEGKVAKDNVNSYGFNQRVYEQLLPLMMLANQIEDPNQDAELHARKLATLFNSFEDAIAYLERFECNSKELRLYVHDACLVSVPEGANWDIKLWQELARKHLPNPTLEKALPFARKIEDYVKNNRKRLEEELERKFREEYKLRIAREYDKTIKGQSLSWVEYLAQQQKISEKSIGKIVNHDFDIWLRERHKLPLGTLSQHERSTLKNLYKNLTIEEKEKQKTILKTHQEAFERKLKDEFEKTRPHQTKSDYINSQLQKQEGIIRANLKAKFQNILSPNMDPETLFQYLKHLCFSNAAKNPRAAEIFLEHGISEEVFEHYLELKPVDDPRLIPDVLIDGAKIHIDYAQYYIKKLLSSDPRAAILGRFTSCCQTLSIRGSKVFTEGITRPECGFYVLCQKKGTEPEPNDPILAQCWAWRGKNNHIVFDSIESQINFRERYSEVISDLFVVLAHRLVTEYCVPRVLTGHGAGTPDNLLERQIRLPELPLYDYVGRDSFKQSILADQKFPYAQVLASQKIIKIFSEPSRSIDIKLSKEDQYRWCEYCWLNNKDVLLNFNGITATLSSEELEKHKKLTFEYDEFLREYYRYLPNLLANFASSASRFDFHGGRQWSERLGSFIENGANPNLRDDKGLTRNILPKTPIQKAASIGDVEVVKALLAKGADSYLALQEAMRYVEDEKTLFELVKILTDSNTINMKNEYGRTPLSIAAGRGFLSIFSYLIETGVDLNCQDEVGNSALMNVTDSWKIDHTKYTIVWTLIRLGANVNLQNSAGDTALLLAIKGLNCVDKLFDKTRAYFNGIIQCLVKCSQIDFDVKNSSGHTALMLAAEKADLKRFSFLVQSGAQISGREELISAVHAGSLKVFKFIVENCRTLSDFDKSLVLCRARQRERHAIVEYFLKPDLAERTYQTLRDQILRKPIRDKGNPSLNWAYNTFGRSSLDRSQFKKQPTTVVTTAVDRKLDF